MTTTRFPVPPKALRKAQLDNIVLMPASALPFKQHYQVIANQLTPGGVLIVLPVTTRSSARVLATTARLISQRGKWVRTVRSSTIASPAGSDSERREAAESW